MKTKIVSLCFCVILVLTAVFTPVKADDALAGRGTGVDAKIDGVEEFNAFLGGANMLLNSYYGGDSAASLATVNSIFGEDVEYGGVKSFTLHTSNFSWVSTASSESFMGGGYSYTARNGINKEMYVYVTQNHTYYRSTGIYNVNVSMNSGNENENKVAHFDFDVELYKSADAHLMKFNKFVVVTEGGREDFGDSRLWISIADGDIGEVFESVYALNTSYLKSLNDKLTKDRDQFINDNGYYSMNSKYVKDYLAELTSFGGDLSGAVTVDLTDKVKSTVTIKAKTENEKSDYDNYFKANSEDVLEFYNINNTAIKLSANRTEISGEEWIERFGKKLEDIEL